MELSSLSKYFQDTLALSGLILAIVSALKNQFSLKGRIPFILSILLGGTFGAVASWVNILNIPMVYSVAFGLLSGLFASGAYDVSSPAGKAIITLSDWFRTRQTATLMKMSETPPPKIDPPRNIELAKSFLPDIDIKSIIPDAVMSIIKLMFPGLSNSPVVTSSFQGIQSLIAMLPPPKQLEALDLITPEVMHLGNIISRSMGAFSDKDQEEIRLTINAAHKKLSTGGYLNVRSI